MYKAAIFDLNGTVINDEPIWDGAYERTLKMYVTDYNEGYSRPSGIGVHETWDVLKRSYDIKELSEVLAEKTVSLYFELLRALSLYRNGLSEYISFLRAKNIPIAMATSSPRYLVERLQKQLLPDLFDLFPLVVTGDMVEHRKPYPDIFLKTLKEINTRYSPDREITPEQCVVFEDSDAGITAAHRAGMRVIRIGSEFDTEGMHSDFLDQELRLLFG